jgi:hypothetical protein
MMVMRQTGKGGWLGVYIVKNRRGALVRTRGEYESGIASLGSMTDPSQLGISLRLITCGILR